MHTPKGKPDLLAVRTWAQDAIHGSTVNPPPWEWYQYMKLVEAIDALMNGMSIPVASVQILTANSQQPEQRQGIARQQTGLRLVQDNSQPRQDKLVEQLPS